MRRGGHRPKRSGPQRRCRSLSPDSTGEPSRVDASPLFQGWDVRANISNALDAGIYCSTGAIALLIGAGRIGGLSPSVTESWIFAAYVSGGLITVALSLKYRMPIGVGWTIAGALLMAPQIADLPLPEIVGGYLLAGFLIALAGVSGVQQRIVELVPSRVVMGTLSAIFAPILLRGAGSALELPVVGAPAIIAYTVCAVLPAARARIPPVLAALGAVAASSAISGLLVLTAVSPTLAQPRLYTPSFSPSAILVVTVPIVLSVIAVHNVQGIVILRSNGYRPPIRSMNLACGAASIGMGVMGSVPACVMGPTVAMLNSRGETRTRYVGAVVFGSLLVVVGLFAPVVVQLLHSVPADAIDILAAFTILPVMIAAARSILKLRSGLDGLLAFVVTLLGFVLLGLPAVVWAMILGAAVHRLQVRLNRRGSGDAPW